MEQPIVLMENIDKSFPNVKAVDNGYFDLRKGEIHSLIGENGAGKSTMMKLLYGLYPIDSGTITIKGQQVERHLTSHKAIDMGVGMVHQEFMLVKELTVLENIILGFEPQKKFSMIDFKAANETVAEHIKRYNLQVSPSKIVNSISVGEAQRVEIIKALYRNADILILDEPTAVLTPQETRKLFEVLHVMRNDGKTIIFISHKLNEVMELSDRITVMRHGKYIKTVNKNETNPVELARLMVSRDVLIDIEKNKAKTGDTIFSVKDLHVLGQRYLSTVKGISFEIKSGEVLGVAGVDGNGQSELVEAITGLRKIQSGVVSIKGTDITNASPLEIRQSGITHIPEDRNLRGLNKAYTVNDNLIAGRTREPKYNKHGWLLRKNIAAFGEKLIKKYDIRPANGNALLEQFSGGNSQKVIVAREVELNGDLLVAAQPTRGVDIGAIESIRNIINDFKSTGSSVLLVSADLDEVISLSDRIIVMHEGKISGELDGDNVDIEKLGLLMTKGNDNHETLEN
jgi:simple sugar transport system ATP-binding protein